MPDQPLHSPAAAARLIIHPAHGDAVNVHTLRRWCAQHAEHLSPGANPNQGKGGDEPTAARWLTDRDIEVLRTVVQLRVAGLDTAAINARLATMTFAVVVNEDDQVDNPDDKPVVTSPTPPATAQEGRSDDLLLPAVLSGIDKRFEGIERRLETRERQAMLWTLGIGVWIGMILMGAIFFAVWLAVNGL